MHCPQCGRENPDGARFCGDCGVDLRDQGPDPYEPAPAVSASGAGNIQPRSLGQLIEATFALYRRAAVPLFIIALVPQVPNMVNVSPNSGAALALGLASFLLAVAASAAGISCVGRAMTGRSTDVLDCYGGAVNVLLPVLAVVVLVALALVGSVILMIIVIGIPLFFFLLVIWSFATHAVVIENRDVFSAFRRSRELVRGNWWRVFGIGLIFLLIVISIIAIVFLVSTVVGLIFNPGTLVFSILGGVVGALLSPVYYIASTLLYIDLRVRKEGYDLQSLSADLTRRPKGARQ